MDVVGREFVQEESKGKKGRNRLEFLRDELKFPSFREARERERSTCRCWPEKKTRLRLKRNPIEIVRLKKEEPEEPGRKEK